MVNCEEGEAGHDLKGTCSDRGHRPASIGGPKGAAVRTLAAWGVD